MPPFAIRSPLVVALAYHYDELVEYARRHFGDRGFARDVVHDVCIALIEQPPAQAVHTPLAFLRRAIKNRAIDRCRTDAVHRRYADAAAKLSDAPVHYADGAHALEFSQTLHALKRIIEALPPRQRQVFLLHRLHDMPQQEIAQELGVSRNMVTQHFTRAMLTIENAWALL